MEVQIVAKEVIKPFYPTIKSFKLSFIDQQYSWFYYKLFFFYQNSSDVVIQESISEKIQRLKSSLSKVLTHFYPLAGKIKDKFSIFTNEDDGVEFLEARVNGTLSQYLSKPKVDILLPHLISKDHLASQTQPLLIIQANFFTCGGLAIGMNIWHGFLDTATLTLFINEWANTANKEPTSVLSLDFSGSLIFPPSNILLGTDLVPLSSLKPNVVTRRFVFSASNIKVLQEKASRSGSQAPSHVKTISAFLWQIAMKMSMSKDDCLKMPFTQFMTTNLRKILPPPICDQSCGNLIELFIVPNHNGDAEMTNLVSLIGKKIENLRKFYKNKVFQGEKSFNSCLERSVEKLMELRMKGYTSNTFTITSWSRFPLYDQDFGWGKPIWVATHMGQPYFAVLIDTSDGSGIEAWVSFPEEDMILFTSDKELSTFATLDPGIHGLVA